MLKHATINRTSRAQQTLQLQRQCQLNQQQQQQLSPTIIDDHLRQQENRGDKSELCLSELVDHGQFQSIADRLNDTYGYGDVDFEKTRSQTSSPIRSIASLSPNPSLLSTPTHRTQQITPAASLIGSPTSPIINQTLPTTSPNHKPQCDSSSMIKVFAQTLSQDVEYITLHVNAQTKSNQIIKSLLRKFRLKHRDPNLFYLTLERWIRKDGLKFKSVMLLGDEACPLQLQQCCSNPPHNDIKFTLQSRTGALVKIFCSDVLPDARYKCLSLSTQTTVEETIELMLHCLNLATPSDTVTNGTRSSTNNSHITNNSHQHHPRLTSSPSSTSSSASTDSSATSSGIESEPNNKPNHNGHSSLPTMSNTGLEIVDSTSCHNRNNQIISSSSSSPSPMLDSNSRTSSVTSISSTSNVSNISSSITDQYCIIIECKDTNYKRILESDEYLVDVYQNLLSEAKGQATISSQYLDVANSNHLTISEPIKQQPEQWFHIKLKRRDDYSQHTIKFTSPRQNLPLPPIPFSLAQQFNNANNLQHIVSMTQIEVNRRPNYISSGSSSTNFKTTNSNLFCKPRSLNSDQTSTTTTTTTISARVPPPPNFPIQPPVRPRRRNLSNASSTFGRPLTVNRRRYDPAQLAEDLNKLNVKEVVVENVTTNGAQLLAAAADK